MDDVFREKDRPASCKNMQFSDQIDKIGTFTYWGQKYAPITKIVTSFEPC